ncbi:uncharacterized protein LOC134578475 [Pelobates fuscus]|uniref:uncharacterized protein LOC134578475 n=1 Tax=Pelobates fuscus TaxID=191477 RepID=UPI002FE4D672
MFPIVPLLLILTFLGVGQSQTNCTFVALLKDLNSNLQINVRPTKQWTSPTNVFLDLRLFAIVDMDMNLQSITTYFWMNVTWRNDFTQWNPETYCGIKSFFVPDTKFWKPDIYISELTQSDEKPLVIPYFNLSSDGHVIQEKPLRIVSTCNLDIYKFPFDTQSCSLTFGSNVYGGKDIILAPSRDSYSVTKRSLEVFASKGEWILADIDVQNYENSQMVMYMPYVFEVKSHLKDTTQMIRELATIKWNENSTLVSMDVTSLYTIIEHEQGCNSVMNTLKRTGRLTDAQINFIIDGIGFILKNNYFPFEGQFYLQKRGDIEELQKFLEYTNKNNWGVSLNTVYSRSEVEFLDLTIYIESDVIKTKTHFKEVDVNSFILKESCHLPTWLKNVPYNEFRRLRRNCTDHRVFMEQAKSVREIFFAKNYDSAEVHDALVKMEKLEQSDLLEEKRKIETSESDKKFPAIILDYNKENMQLKRILRKHWHLLKKDKLLAKHEDGQSQLTILQSGKLLVAPVVDRHWRLSYPCNISIERIPLKYIINIIIPAFLMVCMDIVSMFIHPNGDRLGFKITVVFGFSVILLILNNILPNSDSPPALGIFCCAFMAIMIFSIAGYVLTSYMVDLSFKQSKVPRWIMICFLKKLAPVIGVKLKVAKKDMERVLAVENDCYDNNTKRKLQLYKKRKNFHRKVILDAKILRKMLAEIVSIQEKWNMSISKDNMESEWYTAAEVIQRLILIFYILLVIVVFIFLIVAWVN